MEYKKESFIFSLYKNKFLVRYRRIMTPIFLFTSSYTKQWIIHEGAALLISHIYSGFWHIINEVCFRKNDILKSLKLNFYSI